VKIVVVGAGILGTWIAIHLLEKGHSVLHLERDSEPRGASIRNLGLIWISGRAAGSELDTALSARDRWLRLKAVWPELPFRTDGSITLAQVESEVSVLEAATELKDAGERGFAMLGKNELFDRYGIQTSALGALFCSMDAVTEPRSILSILHQRLSQSPNYYLRTNAEVIYCYDEELELIDHTRVPFDYAFFATGVSDLRSIGFTSSTSRLTLTQLQMLQTGPHARPLSPAIADIDSFRYYPAFASLRSLLGPQDPIAAKHGAQLLLSQRSDGSLTIGDTHDDYGSPFLSSTIEDYLVKRAQALLGHKLPPTTHRWQGVYSKLVPSDGAIYFSDKPRPNVTWITGLAGRGMTISPQVAFETIQEALG
jgi:FAD dependent oxidoreductase TIGR03364